MSISNIVISAVTTAVVLMVVGIYSLSGEHKPLGSVEVGSSYMATTTYAGNPNTNRTLKTGYGTLGSVVITGDNTGTISLYNATTSDITKRTGATPTSTIFIVDFPASSPEGTYTLDADFSTGLLMVTSGTPATSTVTWR